LNFYSIVRYNIEGLEMKLFVDDLRDPPDSSWVVARSYNEAIDKLKTGEVEILSLDHDLGLDLTGYDIISWLEKKIYRDEMKSPKEILVHSANPVGVENIKRAIKSIERFNNLI
jgi:translation initiation factor 2 alpha subunit (eIF-2alpha)